MTLLFAQMLVITLGVLLGITALCYYYYYKEVEKRINALDELVKANGILIAKAKAENDFIKTQYASNTECIIQRNNDLKINVVRLETNQNLHIKLLDEANILIVNLKNEREELEKKLLNLEEFSESQSREINDLRQVGI